jgi:hypothetical protein
MGNKKSTSSSSGGGRKSGGSPRGHKRRTEKARIKSKVKKGIKVVKKELGVTEMKHGPMDYLQTKKGTKDVRALKLKDDRMFGTEVSRATDDYLIGLGSDVAKIGNYFKKEGGNFIRISKSEGEKLYAAGDPSVSRSTFLTSKGKEMKYGTSGGAMGSGDPSGIMTSVPISEAMFQKQKNIQTLALAGMSLAMPMGLAQGMRAVAADTFQRPYSDYISTFYKGQSGEANFAKAEGFANQGKDTANLAMGTTVSDGGEKKSTKFTKKTTKYFAGSYADESKKKRKFFQHGAN